MPDLIGPIAGDTTSINNINILTTANLSIFSALLSLILNDMNDGNSYLSKELEITTKGSLPSVSNKDKTEISTLACLPFPCLSVQSSQGYGFALSSEDKEDPFDNQEPLPFSIQQGGKEEALHSPAVKTTVQLTKTDDLPKEGQKTFFNDLDPSASGLSNKTSWAYGAVSQDIIQEGEKGLDIKDRPYPRPDSNSDSLSVKFHQNPDETRASLWLTKGNENSLEEWGEKVFSSQEVAETFHLSQAVSKVKGFNDLTVDNQALNNQIHIKDGDKRHNGSFSENQGNVTPFTITIHNDKAEVHAKESEIFPLIKPSSLELHNRIESGSSEIRLTVEPEGMGVLDIKLVLHRGVINGYINTTETATANLIVRNIYDIVNSLIRDGLNIGNLSVSLRENNNRDKEVFYKEDDKSIDRARFIESTAYSSGYINIFI